MRKQKYAATDNLDTPADIERSITAAERDKVPSEDFAGPDRTYPIRNQEDVESAAHLVGHAADPEAVKEKIIAIAKRKGLSLPAAWQEDGEEQRSMDLPTEFNLYLPFTRIAPSGEERREIIGVATKEALDTHGTIIGYEASKRAFAAWAGNIREQHDPKKAVGHAIEWWPDDKEQSIFVRAFISKGAEDTWQKILDGTLTGFSVNGSKAKWKSVIRGGKAVPYVDDYGMNELSIVDVPSCPVDPVAILRGSGAVETSVLATDEEVAEMTAETPPPAAPPEQPETIERAGAAMSAANRDKLHGSRDALTQMCADAGCTDCQAMMSFAAGGDDDGDEAVVERMARLMAPVYARSQAMLSDFARGRDNFSRLSAEVSRIATQLSELPTLSSLDAVRAEMSGVKDQVEKLVKTPQVGGPHTGRSATKQLAIDGSSAPQGEQPDLLKEIQKAGVSLTPQQQALLVAGALKRV